MKKQNNILTTTLIILLVLGVYINHWFITPVFIIYAAIGLVIGYKKLKKRFTHE